MFTHVVVIIFSSGVVVAYLHSCSCCQCFIMYSCCRSSPMFCCYRCLGVRLPSTSARNASGSRLLVRRRRKRWMLRRGRRGRKTRRTYKRQVRDTAHVGHSVYVVCVVLCTPCVNRQTRNDSAVLYLVFNMFDCSLNFFHF